MAKTLLAVVLILVLMEDTLRDRKNKKKFGSKSLNPCFNGRYSQRIDKKISDIISAVLILVLMEDTLRVYKVKRYL